MDHFFQIGVVGPAEHEMLEAYTTLGYLAACTSRARLLTLVTGTLVGLLLHRLGKKMAAFVSTAALLAWATPPIAA